MNIKKLLIPLAVSILLGYICGTIACQIYKEKANTVLDSTKIYLLQTGAYSTLDSMKKNTTLGNYLYYQDSGLYKTIIAITKDKANITKIKKIYEDDLMIKEYYLDNDKINELIKKYDLELKETDNINEIKEILNNILNSIKNNDNVKLVKNIY